MAFDPYRLSIFLDRRYPRNGTCSGLLIHAPLESSHHPMTLRGRSIHPASAPGIRTEHKRQWRPVAALAMLVLGNLAPVAQAACPPMGGGVWLAEYTLQGYTVGIDPDAPLGSVLHSQVSPTGGNPASWYCGGEPGGIQDVFYGRLEPVNSSYNTWPTPVAGVGVRIREEVSSTWWPLQAPDTSSTQLSVMPRPLLIEFIKTGPIPTAGGNLTGELGGIWIRRKTQQIVRYRVTGSLQIIPKPPVCTASNWTRSLPFGTMAAHQFPGNVGGTTPEKNLKITLDCTGAAHGGLSRVYITFTDAINPQNRSENLTLTASGSTKAAKGVALQILNNGKPIKYGPDSRAPNTPNQWFVRSTGNGTFDIPLTARYIRTASELTPGSADARVTFTMSYQ